MYVEKPVRVRYLHVHIAEKQNKQTVCVRYSMQHMHAALNSGQKEGKNISVHLCVYLSNNSYSFNNSVCFIYFSNNNNNKNLVFLSLCYSSSFSVLTN